MSGYCATVVSRGRTQEAMLNIIKAHDGDIFGYAVVHLLGCFEGANRNGITGGKYGCRGHREGP